MQHPPTSMTPYRSALGRGVLALVVALVVALIAAFVHMAASMGAFIAFWILGFWFVPLGPWVGAAIAYGALRPVSPGLSFGWVGVGGMSGVLFSLFAFKLGSPERVAGALFWGCFVGAFLAAFVTGLRSPRARAGSGRPERVGAQPTPRRGRSTNSS